MCSSESMCCLLCCLGHFKKHAATGCGGRPFSLSLTLKAKCHITWDPPMCLLVQQSLFMRVFSLEVICVYSSVWPHFLPRLLGDSSHMLFCQEYPLSEFMRFLSTRLRENENAVGGQKQEILYKDSKPVVPEWLLFLLVCSGCYLHFL